MLTRRSLSLGLGSFRIVLIMEGGLRAVSRLGLMGGSYSLWIRLWCSPLGRTLHSRMIAHWPGGYWFWSPETGWPWPGFSTARSRKDCGRGRIIIRWF